jgi:hypothetical protein
MLPPAFSSITDPGPTSTGYCPKRRSAMSTLAQTGFQLPQNGHDAREIRFSLQNRLKCR